MLFTLSKYFLSAYEKSGTLYHNYCDSSFNNPDFEQG
jgi:hypothetical protein